MNLRKKNSEAKFNELWDKWHGPIYKYCLHRLKDTERAKDCMQNTFYTLYESIEKLNINEQIGSWLFRVANNYILKEFRNMRKEQSNISYDEVAEGMALTYEMNIEEDISEEKLEALRKEVLSKLTKEDAKLIQLMYDEKKSVSEISEKLGISSSAVYKRNKVLSEKIILIIKKITENL